MSISVIIPAHNCEVDLERCLGALADSDYEWFECVVVDDGSTDGTGRVAQERGAQVIRVEDGPRGPAHARNIGAQVAQGEILFFLDADVLVYRSTLQEAVGTFSSQPHVAAVFGSYDEHPDHSGFLSQYKNLSHHFVHQRGREDATTFWSGCGAIRRGVFEQVGGFDENTYRRPSIEDIELGTRLKAAGYSIYLNKHMHVKHLKKWSLSNLIQADVLARGVPWTRLIHRTKTIPNDLNLRFSQRLSAILSAALAALLGVGAIVQADPLVPLLLLAYLVVAGNWDRERFGSSDDLWGLANAGVMAGVLVLLAIEFTRSWGLLALVPIPLGIAVRRPMPKLHRTLAVISFATFAAAVAASLAYRIAAFPVLLVWAIPLTLATLILLNWSLYRFFARKKGISFAMAAMPFHIFYYLYSLLAFVGGTLIHVWEKSVQARRKGGRTGSDRQSEGKSTMRSVPPA